MRDAIARRITGAVYLAYFVTSLASGFLTPGVTGPGALDVGAIHGTIYQVGVALGLASTALYLAVVGMLYQVFAPAIRPAGVLVLIFGLTGCALMAVGAACQLAAPHAADGMVNALLALNVSIDHVALVFFGVFQIFMGYAIYRSLFAPRLIGVLVAVAGVGWLTFLLPNVPVVLFIPVAVLGGLAELSLMLWLLIAGVDPRRGSQLQPPTFG